MRDKYAKNNDFFRITIKGDSLVWKEILNHREYFGVGLKWCMDDGKKVKF